MKRSLESGKPNRPRFSPPWRRGAGSRSSGLLRGSGETQFSRARQDGIFQLDPGVGVDSGVGPAIGVANLPQDRDLHGVCAQTLVEDVDCDLDVLIGLI